MNYKKWIVVSLIFVGGLCALIHLSAQLDYRLNGGFLAIVTGLLPLLFYAFACLISGLRTKSGFVGGVKEDKLCFAFAMAFSFFGCGDTFLYGIKEIDPLSPQIEHQNVSSVNQSSSSSSSSIMSGHNGTFHDILIDGGSHYIPKRTVVGAILFALGLLFMIVGLSISRDRIQPGPHTASSIGVVVGHLALWLVWGLVLLLCSLKCRSSDTQLGIAFIYGGMVIGVMYCSFLMMRLRVPGTMAILVGSSLLFLATGLVFSKMICGHPYDPSVYYLYEMLFYYSAVTSMTIGAVIYPMNLHYGKYPIITV